MRKSSLSLASLVAIAAASLSGAAVAAMPRHQPGRRQTWARLVPRGSGSKRYPEQSTRQELRGQRRAQGGPGITLNPRTFEYEPRD